MFFRFLKLSKEFGKLRSTYGVGSTLISIVITHKVIT